MQRCAHSLSTASALRSIFFPTSSQTYISTFLAPSYAADSPPSFRWSGSSTATSVITSSSTTRRSYNSASLGRRGGDFNGGTQQNQQQYQQQPYSRVSHAGPRKGRQGEPYERRRPSNPAADAAALRKFGVQQDRRPVNEEIDAREVLLIGGISGTQTTRMTVGEGDDVDGQSSGAGGGGGKPTHELVSKARVLSQLDLTTRCLVQVGLDGASGNVVCRVIDRKEYFEYEQRRGKVQAAKAAAASGGGSAAGSKGVKQLELNWVIDANDIRHRMKKAVELLNKGYKLEVILMPKKRQKPAPPDQCNKLVDTITNAIVTEGGHKLAKPMEGKIANNATLYFEPKQQKPQEQTSPTG